MNKQQLQQEIESLQKQLEEKQKALAAMPDKWEPKGGGFYVDSAGLILESISLRECAEFGTEFETYKQAEKAAKAMRAHNRLLAYVAEFAPDWEPDWRRKDCEPHCIKVVNGVYEPEYNVCRRIGTVYMPCHVAIELCEKLNSGEVEL